jgi:hypothetical protein
MLTGLSQPPAPSESDPLDLEFQRLDAVPAHEVRKAPWHARLGLSWSSESPPVVLLLLIGMALGPHALSLLSARALAAIDPTLPVALAVLGVQLGLTLPLQRVARQPALLKAASVESLVAALPVILGTLFLSSLDSTTSGPIGWTLVLALGVSAAVSAGLPSDAPGASTSISDFRQLDALLPIVVGGFLLACIGEGVVRGTGLATQGILLSFVIALATWLLLVKASSETEQRVFVGSALLLLGGLADYLSLSAALVGLVAGLLWRLAGGGTVEAVRQSVGYVQHPLLVLMLVTAGARTDVAPSTVALIAAYPVLRTAGKLAGAWLGRRIVSPSPGEGLGIALVAPGIFGIAFALNAVRVLGPASDQLLTIVVLGSIASQLLAVGAPRRRNA